jgi:hypothetical protein
VHFLADVLWSVSPDHNSDWISGQPQDKKQHRCDAEKDQHVLEDS